MFFWFSYDIIFVVWYVVEIKRRLVFFGYHTVAYTSVNDLTA